MVKAIIDIDKETNRVLNIVKAEYDLKDKSQAIEKIAKEFEKFVDIEPEIRPEYVKKLRKLRRGRHVRIDSFAKEFGLK